MRMLPSLIVVALLVAGCKPPPPRTSRPESTEPSLLGKIAGKVQETVTAIEMKDLHLFIANIEITDGKMPTKEIVRDYAKKENPKLAQLLENGTIVLTGTNRRESVWAYEKNAPEKGGWVITNVGESKMTADELKKALGK